ncbi:MAG: hypothetical protein JXA20_12915 [Spirochaetes bacterium]|nr:hypothetical protein [Spirochaetota bacterium]
MRKYAIVSIIAACAMIIPLYSQDAKDKGGTDKKIVKTDSPSKVTVYNEEMLEDFETSQYSDKNLEFTVTQYQKAGLSMRDENPAPTGNSKKYLGIKFLGRSSGTSSDILIIKPAKDIIIEKYCRQISLWVYGRKMAGELSVLVRDAKEVNHRLVFGRLNYLGWRKLSVPLGRGVSQVDDFLNQKKVLRVVQLQYRPMNVTNLPMWHYFYIDDMSGTVREKYTDRQSDDW